MYFFKEVLETGYSCIMVFYNFGLCNTLYTCKHSCVVSMYLPSFHEFHLHFHENFRKLAAIHAITSFLLGVDVGNGSDPIPSELSQSVEVSTGLESEHHSYSDIDIVIIATDVIQIHTGN